MTSGLYHYDLIDNNLHLVNKEINQEMVKNAIRNQTKGTNVVFFWTTSPGRTEYKYSYLSHKMIAMEAGHTCQNLYLACTCIGLGTVAIGAYSQEQCDAMLGVDGQDEFTIYTAAVGRPLKVEGVDKHAN
jgi:SagB-type dehydrogenase family enzyme